MGFKASRLKTNSTRSVSRSCSQVRKSLAAEATDSKRKKPPPPESAGDAAASLVRAEAAVKAAAGAGESRVRVTHTRNE